MLKGCVELLVFKVLLECKDLLEQLVYMANVNQRGTMVPKVLLENDRGERGERGAKGVKGILGDTSDVLSVLAGHLPIQLVTRYGEKICFVKYHVSEDRSNIVESSGGVQTLRNVSVYHEPAWHFDGKFVNGQGHVSANVQSA